MNHPTISNLLSIEWTDDDGNSHCLKILDRVSSKWHDLGLLTRQSMEMLENYKQKSLNDNFKCCKHVFNYWLDRNTSKYPVTWYGLRKLLRDVEMNDVERTLGEALAALTKTQYITTTTTSLIVHCQSM